MHFPTWIDLKGQDSVPDTVHHVVIFLSLWYLSSSMWLSLNCWRQTDVVCQESDGLLYAKKHSVGRGFFVKAVDISVLWLIVHASLSVVISHHVCDCLCAEKNRN